MLSELAVEVTTLQPSTKTGVLSAGETSERAMLRSCGSAKRNFSVLWRPSHSGEYSGLQSGMLGI
jgi:hypothetical protein